jgi:hypothetical protein
MGKSSFKKEKKSNVEDFDFYFESFFNDKEARAEFRKFLKAGLNEEPFLFLEAVRELQATQSDDEVEKAAFKILKTFVEQGSSSEINLAGNVRNAILDAFKTYENSVQNQNPRPPFPKSVFDEAANIVLLEIKMDNFPRFIRSDHIRKWVATKSLEYMFKIAVKRDKLADESLKFDYSDLGQTEPNLSDKDVRFFLALAKDSLGNWKQLKQTRVNQTYISHNQYNFGMGSHEKGLRIFKFQGMLNFDHHKVMNAILSDKTRLKMDGNVTMIRQIDFIKAGGKHKFPMTIHNAHVAFFWPISVRESVTAETVWYDTKDKRYIYICKSCTHSKAPGDKDKVRMAQLGGFIVQQVTDTKTLYYDIRFINLRGINWEWVWDKVAIARGDHLQAGLVKTLSTNDCSQREPGHSWGCFEALWENEKLGYDNLDKILQKVTDNN